MVLGVDDRINPKGGEGVEQGKVIPPSDSDSQSLRESVSSVMGGLGVTTAACLLKINKR